MPSTANISTPRPRRRVRRSRWRACPKTFWLRSRRSLIWGADMNGYLVKPNRKFRLSDWDPDDISGCPGGKEKAEKKLEELRDQLRKLQQLLYAEHKHRLLIVLQGMD